MKNEIAFHVRNAAEEIFRLKISSLSGKPVSTSSINAAIEKAAENIRLEVLKGTTTYLQERTRSAAPAKKKSTAKKSTTPTPKKSASKGHIVTTPKQLSSEMIKTRLRQIIAGAGSQGIGVRSLFQRISNHRDIIGTNLQFGRVEVLVNELLNAQAIKRMSGASDSNLVQWKP